MRVRVGAICGASVVLLLLGFLTGHVHGQSMMVVVTSIDLPDDEDVRMLPGLKYGETPWTVEFTSIRKEQLSDAGVDPVKMSWTLTAHSSRQRPERFKVAVMLVDDSGKTLASAQKNGMIKAGQEGYEMILNMKAKAKQYTAATKVRIRVVFLMS
jgi:hypothetical protein